MFMLTRCRWYTVDFLTLMFKSLLQPRCAERNAPLALSECHLVMPSKLHTFSNSSEMMKKFRACVSAGQVFEKKRKGEN